MTQPSQNPAPTPAAGPDPAIAPGTDPAAGPAAHVPVDTWVRYVGGVDRSVVDVGAWAVGEVKHTPGWLARRLLQNPDFVAVAPPAPPLIVAATVEADEPQPTPGEPVPGDVKTRRRATTTTN